MTLEQKQAIAAQGNILVVAGAGAGKTRTLIERCLAWLVDEANGASVDEILMVTFTQAAATEMRLRLRAGLEAAPMSDARRAEQLALLETAHISTLHSFCFRLVSQHFHDLGLDPQLTVLSGEEAEVLARQTLDGVLDEVYDSKTSQALAIQQLIQAQGGDWDQPVREAIGRVHRYSRTLRDPAAWLASQTARFQRDEPEEWRLWLLEALEDRRRAWLEALQRQPPANENAAQCAAALNRLPPRPSPREFGAALETILQADKSWPRGKTLLREPVKEIFAEAAFLHSLCATGQGDPLAEDWGWVRTPMLALLDATRRFEEAFARAKREAGGIDFQDLEQFALRLLWEGDRPSAIARRWQAQLRLVFVDEFQDINGAQEAIIQALSGEGAAGNRFLVGDVKQSIYRFRLADPGIFVNYRSQWEKEGAPGRVLGLSENFRSHEGILNFVNALFGALMRESVGGVAYDPAAHLRFGARERRAALATDGRIPPPVELHLRRSVRKSQDEEGENASDAEKEARIVCRRLMELKEQNASILDGDARRAPTWRDMVILLRSPRGKAAAYVKEFSRQGVPLVAVRGGFYDSAEARDLLALLELLDNPLQDLPLLAVLRSPLVGMTSSQLAVVRIACPGGRFWTALVDWQRNEEKKQGSPAAEIAGRFLRRFRDWRRLARRVAVSQCLEKIIDETHYADWAAACDRGEQRRGNVERFLHLARQFDGGRGESLRRFLGFLEAQQESEIDIEPAAAPESDAVRLMSIHQSKGLEFPVVAVADLGKRFNFQDLKQRILIDDKYGICPQVKPPEAAQFYPSLPHWLAEGRQRREILGEEMRLLYVAVTRAAQRLILAGTASSISFEERWPARAKSGLGDAEILGGASYLDWIGPWLALTADPGKSGGNSLLSWTVYEENPSVENTEPATAPPPEETDITPEIRDRLDWRYSFRAETELPAKASVSLLRRRISDQEEETSRLFVFDSQPARRPGDTGRLTAAEIGSAHHTFLESVSLERTQSTDLLRAEAERLRRSGKLSPEEAACLDLEALAAFWKSAVGRQLLGARGSIRRELAFTARFAPGELAQLGCKDFAAAGAEEFVVVQGAVDLAVFLPGEIWLLDFKTDQFPGDQLDDKIGLYRPQLALYAEAIAKINQRPVTRRWLHFLARRHTAELH
ncbi:MAG TPA: UvrD-helicase domain-containing protein [Candidatus Baltobacteraceae bacterium]|nr:UvrD-helicase domain-containing protein [Candidatus Baltobacteraceae bacterium]